MQGSSDTLVERWRKPLRIWDVKYDSSMSFFDGERWRPGISFATDHEGMERLNLGWVCLPCLGEPQEEANPEQCSLCGFRIREQQRQLLDWEFDGEVWIGTTIKLEDEFERMEEERERLQHVPEAHALMWLPPGFRF